jgi:hypothetical protein
MFSRVFHVGLNRSERIVDYMSQPPDYDDTYSDESSAHQNGLSSKTVFSHGNVDQL